MWCYVILAPYGLSSISDMTHDPSMTPKTMGLCLHYGTPSSTKVMILTRVTIAQNYVTEAGLRDLDLSVPPMLFIQASDDPL